MIGTPSANPLRASGRRTAHKGRIDDRSRLEYRNDKNALAERGPSIRDIRWSGLPQSSSPSTCISVNSPVAISVSAPSRTAATSDRHTVSVRPDLMARPLAISLSPRAGAKKLILNSVVRMPVPSANSDSAA
jgi:hypothetical protein